MLNLEAWDDILETYGRTMGEAVALTDVEGRLLGRCHNPQPVWSMAHGPSRGPGAGCPFCIAPIVPCTAVAEPLQTGKSAVAHDRAGLSHVAVPLSLGRQQLGAIIAGQTFDRYPEPRVLHLIARERGLAPQDLWAVARRQHPISAAALRSSGELLSGLGHAFLRQRYGAVLETKLADSNGRYRLLVEAVRDYALFTIDAAGRVSDRNVGAERMLGYAEAEIIGQNFSWLFTQEDREHRRPAEQLRVALRIGRCEEEGWRLRKDGSQFLARVTITPLQGQPGPGGGFAVIMEDVTERRKAALVIEEAQQERMRLQDTFLSHVSHELRTPLTAIYFFTSNVADGVLGDLTPAQHEHLVFALENVKQLTEMVDDLLDIARVDTHKVTVQPQHVRTAALVAEVLSTCRTNAALKRVSLSSEVDPNLPSAWADPARVRQILINLIDNAIKFTPEQGAVTVASRVAADDQAFLCLSVSDTGRGITPANQEVIFDRLAQVRSGQEASRSGLGLGLFISRELVLRQGGRIWVSSKVGQGSTFYFTVPIFSLAKLCARVFAEANLAAGHLALISVDVTPTEEVDQTDRRLGLREVLKRCIHPDQDVLLPSFGDAPVVGTWFIVAAAETRGVEIMAKRMRRELNIFDGSGILNPVIAWSRVDGECAQPRAHQMAGMSG
jgi:PAS domain S-box-containing protein